MTEETERQCKATTLYGYQCSKKAIAGRDVCPIHAGFAKKNKLKDCPYAKEIDGTILAGRSSKQIWRFLMERGYPVAYTNVAAHVRKRKAYLRSLGADIW
ncbi:MAG: hypothetical protein PHU12_02830 [Candidatus Aenigmarchaeota archaeon]|nr:hypothetical protein [Candidatus Aenigmarchaeota archaeon]